MPNPLLAREDVLEKFSHIVANSLKIDPSEVTENTYLDDLGADSLDLLEITVDVEEQLHITLPEKDIFHTVRQVFGEGILEKEGLLTDEGKKFLLRRMPDLNPKDLEGEISLKDLNHQFARVGAWVRMIQELMQHTPRQCEACGATLSQSVAGRMRCECGAEAEIPPGDELNRKWVQEYYTNEYLPAHS